MAKSLKVKSKLPSFVLGGIGKLLTLEGAVQHKGRNLEPEDLSIIENAAMAIVNGKVDWIGRQNELPANFKKFKMINARGRMVLPGFVDSHTHLVFAGDRSQEFEMRLAGKTYQEIAAAGGGIVRSMKATREANADDLFKVSLSRVKEFLSQGVTTIEIKTGYGLSFEAEKKCLDVIAKLKAQSPATILSTFLAAHAVPPEYKGRKEDYVKDIAGDWLPKLKKQIDFVDMFIDEGYFDVHDADVLLNEAQKLKLAIKLHADELKLTGGSETAIIYKALSADHLLQITSEQIEALAHSEITATLLPTTAFFLKTNYAPARELLDRGARVALATDFNPGTSPTQDVSLVGLLAALKMKMRTEEIIVGLTLNGAYALGLQNLKGALVKGFDADFMLIEAESPAKLFYEFGRGWRPTTVFCRGTKVH
jgi:imidazolonepropionase